MIPIVREKTVLLSDVPEMIRKVAADLCELSRVPKTGICFALEDNAMELEWIAAVVKAYLPEESA